MYCIYFYCVKNNFSKNYDCMIIKMSRVLNYQIRNNFFNDYNNDSKNSTIIDIWCISCTFIKLELIFPMVEHKRYDTIIKITILIYNRDIWCILYTSVKLELIFPMIEHTRCITITTIIILPYNRDVSCISIKNNFSKNYDWAIIEMSHVFHVFLLN